jgi:hypothetical protein
MHHARGFALTVAATVVVTLGIAVVPLVLIARPTEKEEMPKVRGIKVRTSELAIVPDLPKPRRDELAKELEIFLDLFYTEAFVPAAASATPSPFNAVRRVDRLLTAASRKALASEPAVFDLGGNLNVTQGNLDYTGVVTTADGKPIEAILQIDLDARAALTDEDVEVAKIAQSGKLFLTREKDSWHLRGFDLELTSSPLPTPTPR